LASADENQPEARALGTIGRYIRAEVREDVEGLVAVMHPLWVSAQGGWDTLVSKEREHVSINAIYRVEPEFIELGTPKLVLAGDLLFAVVPARSLTHGFPEDTESRLYYLAVSEDRGETWYVLEMSCAGEQWATTHYPGYPQKQITRAMVDPFVALSRIRPSGRLEVTDPGIQSPSLPH
jgi:hypothetical protein